MGNSDGMGFRVREERARVTASTPYGYTSFKYEGRERSKDPCDVVFFQVRGGHLKVRLRRPEKGAWEISRQYTFEE